MWSFKNSKELLEHLKSPTVNHVTSIKSLDFSTRIQPSLTRNLKKTSVVLSKAPSFSKTVTVDTNIWYYDTKKPILWRSTLILKKTSALKKTLCKMHEFLVDNIIVVFYRTSLPADSRHSNGYELCPSSRRHLCVRSGIHTVFALSGKETVKHLGSISLTGTLESMKIKRTGRQIRHFVHSGQKRAHLCENKLWNLWKVTVRVNSKTFF